MIRHLHGYLFSVVYPRTLRPSAAEAGKVYQLYRRTEVLLHPVRNTLKHKEAEKHYPTIAVVGQFDITIHRYAMNVCLKARDSLANR